MKHIPSAFGTDRVVLTAADLACLAAGGKVSDAACEVTLDVPPQSNRDAFLEGARWAQRHIKRMGEALVHSDAEAASHIKYPDPGAR